MSTTLLLAWNCFCCGLVCYAVGLLALQASYHVHITTGWTRVRVSLGSIGLWLIVAGSASSIIETIGYAREPTVSEVIQNTGLGLWNMVVTLGLVVGTARALIRETTSTEEMKYEKSV